MKSPRRQNVLSFMAGAILRGTEGSTCLLFGHRWGVAYRSREGSRGTFMVQSCERRSCDAYWRVKA